MGLLWTRDRPVAETSTSQDTHSQQTDIHAFGGIRTRNQSTRAAADLCHTAAGIGACFDIAFYIQNEHPVQKQGKTLTSSTFCPYSLLMFFYLNLKTDSDTVLLYSINWLIGFGTRCGCCLFRYNSSWWYFYLKGCTRLFVFCLNSLLAKGLWLTWLYNT